MNPEIIGTIAAFLTTVAYIPQVAKVLKHKNTQSISLGMYVMITSGLAAWFVYGVMIDSPSVIIANAITFFLALIILVMKIKHG